MAFTTTKQAQRAVIVGGAGSTCRDNGGGTKDCGIGFAAALDTTYYAILEPVDNGYGWRVTYVGIGGA